MGALPPALEIAIAATLVASIRRAFFGAPPDHSDGMAAAAWMLAGLVLISTVLLAGEHARPRDVLTAAGVEAICVAGWWLRRADGGHEPPADPDGAGPVDWDAFDRARSGWRPRQTA